jgi:glycosyltransferase involved in cell wall biosynthesis
MRIAQLAPIYERVPPATYGGTELVVSLLTEALVRRGHEVSLFATGDSITRARLVALSPEPLRYGIPGRIRHPEWIQLATAQACFRAAEAGQFDIVHNHTAVEGVVLAAASRTPVVTTNHMTYEPMTRPIWSAYPWLHHGVSGAHGATYPDRGRLPAIHHGLDVANVPFGERPEGYLLFLGRFSPEKGPDVAARVAQGSGLLLLKAGKVDTVDQVFFGEHVAPYVDGDRVQVIGEVDADQKRRLMAGADALLFPIRWDEPFGLVMIEALATGTPVVAFGRGSVPEIVEDGRTGFVLPDGDIEGLEAALGRIHSIDRAACRRSAEERFGLERMVDDYERMFQDVIDATRRGEAPLPAEPWVPVGPGPVADDAAFGRQAVSATAPSRLR